jgi:hypothetical protein
MTKSTGKRAAQKRREELFRAELTLASALLHLHSAASWARLLADPNEFIGICLARARVSRRLREIRKEQRSIA